LVPGQCFGCHPCPWTKLLPMCPDRTMLTPNIPLERTAGSHPLAASAQRERSPAPIER